MSPMTMLNDLQVRNCQAVHPRNLKNQWQVQSSAEVGIRRRKSVMQSAHYTKAMPQVMR